MTDKPTIIEHVTGSLLGAVIGDALGIPADGMSTWQVLKKFNLIDGFYSEPKYSFQSGILLDMVGAISVPDWTAALATVPNKDKAAFSTKGIILGLAGAISAADSNAIRKASKEASFYPSDKKDEGLAIFLTARVVMECVRNHNRLSRPYDLYDSEGSLLNSLYLDAAKAEEKIPRPMRDSMSERLTLVRSRLMRFDTLNSFVGINAASKDHFESLPLSIFAFMNEPDEPRTICKAASLGHASSQNASLVGAFVGGILGASYFKDFKEVKDFDRIHTLAVDLVEALVPKTGGLSYEEVGDPTQEEGGGTEQ